MSTKHSPLRVLKAQADKAAEILKKAERGEPVANDPAGKIAASLATGVVKFAVAMDDKVVFIEMPWDAVRASSEVALSEFILAQMQEQRAEQ